MNYVSVENIAKGFGERILFKNISFGINEGQKIGFVAKNGTGKTSLLDIVAGDEEPDEGQVVYRKNLKVAFLPQEPNLDPALTIEQTIFASDNDILQVINTYEKALLNPDDVESYQQAFEKMDAINAWDFETQYKQILFKLKLEDLNKKVSELSGGQKKRLALANILLSKPNLLYLDEPTNHLDLEMIEWLEEYFAKENFTLFMVTHDRYFLENVCNEIIELENGQLYSYKGNYAYYLANKEARIVNEQITTDKAKQLYKKELDWMRRQPKARTTKSKSRIDDFYEIKERAHKRRNDHEVQLEINMERMGSKILELHKISKRFDKLILLDQFEYVFKKGERIGIIGKNGTGKSTFLNMITGSIPPDHGKIVIGDTIKFGYYTQSGITIKEGQKVIDVIREFGDYIPLKKGRQISAQQLLERFLFDRKKQYDFVEKLSGGERKRLYLCTVLIQNPNFLILDEPTNDLDIVTLNVLENFLLDFPGCLIVVSHDRYFMDKIVDHLFVFRGNGVIQDFPGNYTDYRIYEDSKEPEVKTPDATETKVKNTWKKDNKTALSYNEQKEFNKIERELKKLELQKKEIENLFAEGNLDEESINTESKKLQKIIQEIEENEMRWFELSEKMEE
ncbi:ATP-binding cassette subfamily F protein uup [Aquimarina sp. EL_43]|uniref:ABC-F family ATP-binding cassette domain-containing protein n=1 Tax=unclassified Aquimarina TaxID=2627091 RepID=UPI0018CB63C9|nr:MULTISPECIES: ABC-F family ATP-binding cassette domain-containing protein [unclassified Aquimarina]MBG6128753.1 ATP-binding cassette subfamily F protein uup [Aquimarina sp. EL_35]MBG6149816.1 ATP-binding cassette subfamily F protein uup [Aquimarina sp. EL_32]MBG6167497.1 ATP-binding cassette subfamily F protein uup [Aquimarina sp. EL_43]